MIKEMYYKSEDALKRAEAFAAENNGVVDNRSAMVDHHMHFDYIDDEVLDMCWSGDCAAYRVKSRENYMELGLFGYWD